jgi:hypothetical protein
MAGEAWWENCFLPLYNYMSPTSILFRYLPIAISLSVCCPLSGCTVHSLHCYLLTYVGQTSKTSHAGGEARWTGLGNLIVPLRELHPTMPNHARGAVRSVRRCITLTTVKFAGQYCRDVWALSHFIYGGHGGFYMEQFDACEESPKLWLCDAPPFTKGRTPVYLCHSLDQ